MDILDLRLVAKIAELKHFTNAAYETNISESSLSKRITALEDELGVKLFLRNTRHVELTTSGEIVAEFARNALLSYDEMRSKINATAIQPIKVGLIDKFHELGFTEIASGFYDKFPHILLEITQGSSNNLIQQLLSHELDLIFAVVSDLVRERKDLAVYPVLEDELVLVVNKKHRFAKRQRIQLPDLSEETFVGLDSTAATTQLISKACAQYGFAPNYALNCANVELLLGLVAGKMGIGLIARKTLRASHYDRDAIVEIAVEPAIPRTTAMIVPKRNLSEPSVRTFVHHVLSCL